MVPIFKNVGERSATKKYSPVVFFLWLVKSLKNVNNLENCGLFSDFQYSLSLFDQLQIF